MVDTARFIHVTYVKYFVGFSRKFAFPSQFVVSVCINIEFENIHSAKYLFFGEFRSFES